MVKLTQVLWKSQLEKNSRLKVKISCSEKSEPPKVLEAGERLKRNRQRPRYLEDYVV